MSDIVIRDVTATDEQAWRALWEAYCTFYETVMPEAITAATWRRILDPAETAFGAIVAVQNDRLAGFANYVVHPYTWSEQDECLLHDLYVDPYVRGAGIGEQLISFLIERGRHQRWTRVYWVTKDDNARARRLYDRFAPADGFIRYSVPVPAEPTEEA
jgi:GNAT superfamily N-acetyltransferase